MAATNIEICNTALAHCGTRRITALTDPSKEARNCNDQYDLSRKSVLRMHPWNFAIKRATLTGTTITNAVDDGGGLILITAAAHGFTTGDRVTVADVQGTVEANQTATVTVVSANTFTIDGSTFTNTYVSGGVCALAPTFGFAFQFDLPNDFIRVAKVMDDSECELTGAEYRIEAGTIVTDYSVIWLKYVYDIQDPTAHDALFDDLLALHLASKIVYKLTGSESSRDSVTMLLRRQMRQARFVDSVEDPSQPLDVDEWDRARLDNTTGFVRDPMT